MSNGADMKSVVPQGTCLVHGRHAGWVCPACVTGYGVPSVRLNENAPPCPGCAERERTIAALREENEKRLRDFLAASERSEAAERRVAALTEALAMAKRIAVNGVGADTSPEEALGTIAAYIGKRLDRAALAGSAADATEQAFPALAGFPCTNRGHGLDGSVRDEQGRCAKCDAEAIE